MICVLINVEDLTRFKGIYLARSGNFYRGKVAFLYNFVFSHLILF